MGVSKDRKDKSGEPATDPRDCLHKNLARVESDINEIDTDVLLYECTACRKSFTITDY